MNFILLSSFITLGALMSELYEAFKDGDGFLYMVYSAENTLGRRDDSEVPYQTNAYPF